MAVGSLTTPRGIHYFAPGDAPDLAGITQQIATDVDTDLATGAPRAKVTWSGSANVADQNTTIPHATWTPVYARKGMTAAAAGITVPKTGEYQVDASNTWGSNATGRRGIYLSVNGAIAADNDRCIMPAGVAGNLSPNFSAVLRLNAGDLLSVINFQSSGGGLTLVLVTLAAFLIGEA